MKSSNQRLIVQDELRESATVHRELETQLAEGILRAAKAIIQTLKQGGKVLLFGNGGSAADAQHIAAELVGRFERNRSPYSAVALTTDTSIITSVANDYGFEQIFARQVESLAHSKDILLAISTSGNSENVLEAVRAGKKKGCCVIGLTGQDGGQLGKVVDLCLAAPSNRVCRIQEAHITIGHVLCKIIEQSLFEHQSKQV